LEKALNFKPGALTMTRLNKMAGIVDDLGGKQRKLVEQIGSIDSKGQLLTLKIDTLRKSLYAKRNSLARLNFRLRNAQARQLTIEKARIVFGQVELEASEYDKTRKRTKAGEEAKKRHKKNIDLLTNADGLDAGDMLDPMDDDENYENIEDEEIVPTLADGSSNVIPPSAGGRPWNELTSVGDDSSVDELSRGWATTQI